MHCYCLTTTTGAALTPDGRRVLSAYGFDSTAITIWDATTGRNVGELTDPNGSVAGVAVSGDGRFFVSFGEDPDVRPVTLWDLRRRSRIANFPTRGSTSVAAFAPRSSILAVSDESGVVLWNARTRHRLGELPGQTTAMSLAFTGDGRTLAVGTEGGTIRLWNTSTRKAFGRALVPQSWVMGLAFSPDGRVLLSSDDEGMVRLWDVGNRSLIERIRGHLRFVNSVAIAPDGTSFASAGQDGTVRIWHGGAHPLASPIQGASDAGEPTFDPESRRLALDVGNGSTRVLRVSDGRTAAVLPGASKGSTWALAWSPDGRRLATSDEDGSVSVWDVASRKRLKRFHRSTLRRAVDVAFAPDGKVLAAIWQDGSVAFFDAHKLKWLSDPLDADQILTGLAFVDGGATLATVGSDLLFWDVARHRVRKRVEIKVTGIDAIAAAPGGELLALGGDDGRIRLWRTHGGRVGEPLVGHSDEGISDLAFSPNGRLLASGGVDGTFRLWDAGARRPIGGPITVAFGSPSVDFSGDGQYLASSTDGGAAFVDPLVWRGDLRGYTQRLCPIAGRSLNRAEWREFLPGIPYRRTCG
jgi:WD40 repeat protein